MAFELKIKNLGKLTDATVRIGQFTVLAGPNNTGKSFVSKSLYSIFDAANANFAEVFINDLISPIEKYISAFSRFDRSDDDLSGSFLEEFEKMESAYMGFSNKGTVGLDVIIRRLTDSIETMQAMFPDVRAYVESAPELQRSIFPDPSLRERRLDGMERNLNKLQRRLNDVDEVQITLFALALKIRENLIQNFQVPNLSDLRGNENVPPRVNIDFLGEFLFSAELGVSSVKFSGIGQLQQYSKVIYLESPVYWKLKNALEDIRLSPRFRHSDREQISGIPGYFYDLASALRQQYSGDMDFPEIYEKLTGKDILDGKIVISDTGDLSFQENGRSFSLPVTAMGVTNLGILALLIERKVLDKGAFIFIDEPEAHLHPAWQVVMAETLFALAKGGANVVIATHSADILKWLEVHVKKNPGDEGMIALNKFPFNGDDADGQDFSDRVAAIKEELTRPFADLYTAGL